MATITLTLPDNSPVVDGRMITFRAPCDCSGVTGVIIEGTTYSLVNTINESVADSGSIFSSGALVSILLDTTNSRAYIQSAASGSSKSILESTIMSSSKWDTVNKTYSFEDKYPSSTSYIEIELNGDSCTTKQLEAWNNAQLVGSSTSNICKALGEVPTIDIPIILKISVLDESIIGSAYYTKNEINIALAGKAPVYTYGTEDLTAGISELATGTLHFIYE